MVFQWFFNKRNEYLDCILFDFECMKYAQKKVEEYMEKEEDVNMEWIRS